MRPSPISITIALAILFDIAAGAWPIVSNVSLFRRFGAEALVPAVSALSIMRETGPHLALVTGAMFATAAAFARASTTSPSRPSNALEAGVVVMAAYPVACALAFVGAVAASAALAGQSPSMFLVRAREILVPSDLAAGLLRSAVYAVPCATWAALATRLRPATTRGLAFQIAAVFLACQSLFVVEDVASNVGGPDGGNVWERSGVPRFPSRR